MFYGVMANVLESPYCQFCIFEKDCTGKDKFDARAEGDSGKGWHNPPSCYQYENSVKGDADNDRFSRGLL